MGSQLRFARGQLAYGQPLQLAFASFPGSFVEGAWRGRPARFFLRIAPAMSCIRSGDQMIIRKFNFNIGAAPFLICFSIDNSIFGWIAKKVDFRTHHRTLVLTSDS